MKHHLIPASMFAALGGVAGTAMAGPYDQVYAVVSAEFHRTADWHLKPVILNRIDDNSTTFKSEAVSPGKHVIVADLPPSKAHHQHFATQRTLELDMQPCMRYFIAARLDNEVSRRWELVVQKSESLGECEAKFLNAPKQ